MKINIAVSGDTHGHEFTLFDMLPKWEEKHGEKIDLVLLSGDMEFIASLTDDRQLRNVDTNVVSEYIEGVRKAPYLTVFTGGNNDAWDLLGVEGGFIGHNMYYLGRAGVMNFKGLKIGGIGGSYNKRYVDTPLPKSIDLSWGAYRKEEVDKLMNENLDILLLHDWISPFAQMEIKEKAGIHRISKPSKRRPSNYLAELVKSVQPKYVFMGHKHRCYIDGKIRDSQIYGLKQVKKDINLDSTQAYKVISIETGK